MKAVIVSNLGKKYLLSHIRREPYLAFRDVIVDRTRRFGRRIVSPFDRREDKQTREDFWALKDVSFDVAAGERYAVIGRNGAGKSTLLKILSRITDPTTGSARIRGRVASLLEVGTGFHPELTGRENIFLNGSVLGMSRHEIKRKFDEIVDFAEVERFLDTPVKRYSSGMYVRLAFAVAAHLEPEILVIDEVLAVGDAKFQKKCLGKMENVAQEGRTILFVSHNMAAVNQLCQYGIWLDYGKVRSIGAVTDIVEQYVASGAEAEGERLWNGSGESPGNEKIRLHGVRLRNVQGELSSFLDMAAPFTVEIEYDILEAHHGMRTGFWVYTHDGVLVFVAGDSVDPAWQGRRRVPGRYVSTCTIPGMLLNSGSYSLTVAADIQGVEMLFVEHYVLHFRLEHTGFTELDGASRSPGIICPSLEWRVVQVGEIEED